MEDNKYTEIKDKEQYYKYCDILEKKLFESNYEDCDIKLLTLLIEKWDNEHNTFNS